MTHLVCAGNETELVFLQKGMDDVSTKREGHTTVVLAPPTYVLQSNEQILSLSEKSPVLYRNGCMNRADRFAYRFPSTYGTLRFRKIRVP